MLKEKNKCILPDQMKKNDVGIDINYNSSSKNSVRVKIGEESAVVLIKDLYSLVLAICSPEEQTNLMPIRQTEMTTYSRRHTVIAKADIKRGQKITFVCEINVPTVIEEGLRGTLLDKKKSRFAL